MDNDEPWEDFHNSDNFDPDRMKDPKHISELIGFMTKLDGMEEFLMQTAFESIEDDMQHFLLYPKTEVEKQCIQDLIEFYIEREEYEKCEVIVKYLKLGSK